MKHIMVLQSELHADRFVENFKPSKVIERKKLEGNYTLVIGLDDDWFKNIRKQFNKKYPHIDYKLKDKTILAALKYCNTIPQLLDRLSDYVLANNIGTVTE